MNGYETSLSFHSLQDIITALLFFLGFFHLQYQVKFRDKVFLTNVFIYETFNAGGVKRILAKDAQNRWIEIFWVSHAVLIRKARKFSPKIKVSLNYITE